MTSAFAPHVKHALRLVGCSLVPLSAAAQPAPGLELNWQAPAGCPQAASVRERIRTLAPSPKPRTKPLKAEGRITRMDGRFRLALVVRDGEVVGERTIESDSCADLGGAAAVALGLLLNSDSRVDESADSATSAASAASAASATPATSSSSETSNAPGREPSPSQVEKPKAAENHESPRGSSSAAGSENDPGRSRRSMLLALRAPLVALDVGPFPSPSWSFGGGIGLQRDAWRFSLTGRVSLRQKIWAKDFSGYGADVGRAVGELSICRAWRASHFEVAPCVNLAAQWVTATGIGDSLTSSTAHTLGFGGGLGVVGTWRPTQWLGIFTSAAGTIEASRPRIVIEGLGEVYQLAPATLTLAVGSEWTFL